MKMVRLNIRARTRESAMNLFKKRYGRNYTLNGIGRNFKMPLANNGMNSYTVVAKRR